MVGDARAAVLGTFQWQAGHADVWRVFADGRALGLVVQALVAPWRDAHVTHVVGIEARGFVLGGACAVALDAGFVAIRKEAGLLPGPKLTARADADYRGQRPLLRMQRALHAGDRVLLVDDWAERGSQAGAARALVVDSGATYLGAAVIVDQLDETARGGLGRVTSVITATELGEPNV